MTRNVDSSKILKSWLEIKRRADAGDPKAKADLAKIQSNPQVMSAITRMVSARKQMVLGAQMLAMLSASDDGSDNGNGVDEIVGDDEAEEEVIDDEILAAERAHESLPAGSDSLDHKALLRNNKTSALNQQAPFVSTNPPSVLAGISGNQAEVAPGDLTQVCNWQGDDAHTTTLSLVIAPVQPLVTTDTETATGYPTNFEARPYARIQFGNKAFAVSALVDIGSGVQFDVSGSMVTIEVGLKALPAGSTLGTMKLAGMVSSYKSIMRTAPLYYTIYVDNGLVLDLFKVPAFARRVTFLKANASLTEHVVLRMNSPSTPGSYDFDIPANTQQTVPLPIAGDIQLIQAFDTATDQNAVGRFIFELGI